MASPSVDDLLSEDRLVQKRAIEQIYDYCSPRIQTWLNQQPDAATESGDILQMAVSVAFQNIKNGTFKGQSSITTYTLSICRNIWFNTQKKESHLPKSDLHSAAQMEEIVSQLFKFELMQKVMGQLGTKCQQVLRDFYYEKRSMDEITEKYGWDNRQIAKNTKWRCMKKLADIVKSHKLKQEDFYT